MIASASRPLDSPWMEVAEVARYARAGRTAVILALEAQALRGYQIIAGGKWRIHRDDVDAWLRGEPPVMRPQATARRSA